MFKMVSEERVFPALSINPEFLFINMKLYPKQNVNLTKSSYFRSVTMKLTKKAFKKLEKFLRKT